MPVVLLFSLGHQPVATRGWSLDPLALRLADAAGLPLGVAVAWVQTLAVSAGRASESLDDGM